MNEKHTISKIAKRLKFVAITVVSLCVVLFVAEKIFWHVYSLPKHNEKETQSFLQIKDDAEAVNKYIIENFGHKANSEDNTIFVAQENGKVVGLSDGEHIEIPDYLCDAFNSIKSKMNQSDTDFFVDVEADRISYGGLSHSMYVYSRNGKAPSYYYHQGDGMHPEVYDLGDNWYLLKVNFR